MNFASPEVETAFWKCDPRVQSLAFTADAYCHWYLNCGLKVTSGLRRGDEGVHGKGRAVDCVFTTAWTQKDAQALADWINGVFPYEGKDGTPFISKASGKAYITALVETKGINYGTRPATGNCIHLQVRP